jgi:glycosyltransferase involved in cell wall biosynthesis
MGPAGDRTVAVAFHEPVVGGAAIAVLRILPMLEERGWRFTFWTPGPGPLRTELESRGYAVAGIPRLLRYSRAALSVPPGPIRRLASVPGYLHRFRRWVREQAPAIVHANTLILIPEAFAARGASSAVLLYVHEILPPDRRGAAAARLIGLGADTVVANSERSAAALRERGVSAHAVHNGVELPELPEREASAGRELVIGTLGTVSHRKGSDLFLALADRVRRELPGAEFRMIGPCPEGSEQSWASDLVRAAEAQGVVTGARSDVFSELSEWDLLVLPSRNEPFGLVVVEAMASGLPVVATRVGGLPEIVAEDTGVLVEVNDLEAAAEAVLRLAREPLTRAAMGRAGRARVERHFTLERQAEGVHEAYCRALAVPADGGEVRAIID